MTAIKSRLAATIFISLLFPATSFALSWDSNANLDLAIKAARRAFESGGQEKTIDITKNCFHSLDTRKSNPNLGRNVEYCVALGVSGYGMARNSNSQLDSYYISPLTTTSWGAAAVDAGIAGTPEQALAYIMKIAQSISDKMDQQSEDS